MNFNICNKCKNKRDKYFIAISPPEKNKKGTVILSNRQHCFMIEEDILDIDEFYRYREEYERFISFDDIKTKFPNITVNEMCPYYMEHQLSDWNEK